MMVKDQMSEEKTVLPPEQWSRGKRYNKAKPPTEITQLYASDSLIIRSTENWEDFLFPRAVEIVSPKGPLSEILGVPSSKFSDFFESLFTFIQEKQLKRIIFRFEYYWKYNDKGESEMTKARCFLVMKVDVYNHLITHLDKAVVRKQDDVDPILGNPSDEEKDGEDETVILSGEQWVLQTKKCKQFLDAHPKEPVQKLSDCPIDLLETMMFNGLYRLAIDRKMPELNVTCNANDVPFIMRVYVPEEWEKELYSPIQEDKTQVASSSSHSSSSSSSTSAVRGERKEALLSSPPLMGRARDEKDEKKRKYEIDWERGKKLEGKNDKDEKKDKGREKKKKAKTADDDGEWKVAKTRNAKKAAVEAEERKREQEKEKERKEIRAEYEKMKKAREEERARREALAKEEKLRSGEAEEGEKEGETVEKSTGEKEDEEKAEIADEANKVDDDKKKEEQANEKSNTASQPAPKAKSKSKSKKGEKKTVEYSQKQTKSMVKKLEKEKKKVNSMFDLLMDA
ncbi:uncharacterized protein MONOS_2211 [Monocercomonoides exilis]|uniref:uncharacterized protein n=1 Tax=Monocercomonoides exilis TaxID=2049356 RepID=UPI00355A2759|nr:hypothetical protein MONOS_2211 [Monocercomonoides exilis]|eukprot:MONOS_2211.1-p1 / transcript=MONOS_2211.1 / gene=MONOS_2211 / organism=Monocercomonoides_exilis_PA203 / gene_product=unspecified product / transcript_product=unspecified product / location=Mono_scaffold00044:57876-60367(+) / protein_length=511 / sequence_SO=supercontig / SO=protein_coding / is_pseudo=false